MGKDINDGLQFGVIDGLSIFSDVLQILNYIENTRQSSNDQIMKLLHRQNGDYLEVLVEDCKKLIKNQEKIISDLSLIKEKLNIIERVD